ncbi:MAG TPA: YbaK/EbsC family protein [Gaiellaceae bacterium]|jgi:Ala-tRNA(Pro) deacylase
MTTDELMSELQSRQIDYELIPHRQTMTASDEAAEIGVSPEEVAKTLVLFTEADHVRAVLPASERLDLHKVRELLGEGKSARLASEDELAEAYPMFELGAVPPFGGPGADRTILDRRLAARGSVVVEAGSHTESVRIKTDDLLSLTRAEVADICED